MGKKIILSIPLLLGREVKANYEGRREGRGLPKQTEHPLGLEYYTGALHNSLR